MLLCPVSRHQTRGQLPFANVTGGVLAGVNRGGCKCRARRKLAAVMENTAMLRRQHRHTTAEAAAKGSSFLGADLKERPSRRTPTGISDA